VTTPKTPERPADPTTAVQIERLALSVDGLTAAVLWLNRPQRLNALSWDLLGHLEEALKQVDQDPTVRVVLVTGRGRAFSSGGDLKDYLELQQDAAAFSRFLEDFHRTLSAIRYMKKPVVALVNGWTAAGGLELLLSCDFAYAAASARIGDAHLNFGQMGGGGALALLPRMIGAPRARELFFSGRFMTAEEALGWGLVNAVLPDDGLLDAGVAFAEEVAAKSARAVANGKLTMNRGFAEGTGLEAALRLERSDNAHYVSTFPDSMEGLRAFAEGRRPENGSSA
jgi:enoyl-CoA hydratase/carnithine racemase